MAGAILTSSQLIDVLRRTTDESWLNPLLADNASAAVLNTIADIWARVSEANDAAVSAGLISLAPGGAPGVATITLTRTVAGPGGTLPRGTRWVDVRGIVALNVQDIIVPAGPTVVTVPVETVRQNELLNTIDEDVFVLSPENPAAVIALVATFAITASPITTSVSDFLSVHGNERGQKRQTGEDTEHYRLRVRNIPDSVSPKAVAASVTAVAQQQKLPSYTLYETEDDGADPSLRAALHLGVLESMYAGTGFDALAPFIPSDSGDFLDDSIDLPGFPGSLNPPCEIVSRREACAYFQLRTDSVPRDPTGLRFFFDGDSFVDDPVYGFLDVTQHPALVAGFSAINEEADRKRAACIQFDQVITGFMLKVGQGNSAAAVATVVWGFALPGAPTPPVGKVWYYIDGWFAHIAFPGSVVPAGASHQVRFDFTGGATIFAPVYPGTDSQRIPFADLGPLGAPPGQRVTGVSGIVTSDGVQTLSMIGLFRVLEVTL